MEKEARKKAVSEALAAKVYRPKDKSLAVALTRKLDEEGVFASDRAKSFIFNTDGLRYLHDAELCIMAYYADELKPGCVGVRNYYTEDEIRRNLTYRRRDASGNELYRIGHAVRLADNQWACIASVSQIALLKSAGIIRADENLQRDLVVRQYKTSAKSDETEGEKLIREIKVNSNRVREIAEAIVGGKYYYNSVRFNVLNYDEESCIREDGIIQVPKDGDVVVLDGNHRVLAAEVAYTEHPELRDEFDQTFFSVIFTFLKTMKARECISQEWNTEKISERRKQAMKIDFANMIVEGIRQSEDAEPLYRDHMYADRNGFRYRDGVIDEVLLSRAIQAAYKTDGFTMNAQANAVKSQLIRVFNEIALLFSKDLSNVRLANASRWNIHPIAWCAYVWMAKYLESVPNWQYVLGRTLSSFDFRKDESFEHLAQTKSVVQLERVGNELIKEAEKYV